MERFLKRALTVIGVLSVAYYIVLEVWKPGLNIAWIWLVCGLMLAAAGLMPGGAGRVLRRLAAVCLVLAMVVIGVLDVSVIRGMDSVAPEGLDYVIVLGAKVDEDGEPSLALRHRIDAAAAYLEANPDTKAVACGGQGSDEPCSEAECIARELQKLGIDGSRVLQDTTSTSTEENMANALALIGDPSAGVAIVTNNYHVSRAVMLAKRAGFTNVSGLAATYVGPSLPHYIVREAICLIVDGLRQLI